MNPLANNILIFSIGVLLMSIAAVNCRAVKATLSEFKQWCIHDDLSDVIAALIVIGVAMSFLLSWGWY